jgi:hypothetical protein
MRGKRGFDYQWDRIDQIIEKKLKVKKLEF